ncbi:uncharacterized protein LOC126374496 [Pectinophora gossypiella]|uniref:uncharacterized protein LOC126374496 n=1 Tax=Pectinophora gossypiella TaxID=13191 RepID=UPI00214EE93D|nr:uncharacterized protein LOC126374496 [Pectinophora gossypiella]
MHNQGVNRIVWLVVLLVLTLLAVLGVCLKRYCYRHQRRLNRGAVLAPPVVVSPSVCPTTVHHGNPVMPGYPPVNPGAEYNSAGYPGVSTVPDDPTGMKKYPMPPSYECATGSSSTS